MFKKFFAVAALATCVAAPVMAQETEYKPYPHIFVGVQGGAQTTLTNYDNLELITPTASVSVGGWFTSVVGARLHVNGLWNQGGVASLDKKYDYKYVTTDADLMLNLVTLFGKKEYYPLNVYLIGGIGLNTAWDNDDAYAMKSTMPLAWKGNRLSHNARVGAQLDWNLCKNLSLNLEVAANSLSDRYNSKISEKDDWQLTAQLGLAVKFGHKKKPAPVVIPEPEPEPEPEPVYATRIDTTWYEETIYEDVTRDREIKKEIFYGLAKSDVNANQEQILAVAEFLKNVKDAEITITGYADKGTGTPQKNMGYSKQRAEQTKKALIKAGVDPKVIKVVEWKGDTVQPYAENDKNRLAVITGHGVYTDKEAKTVKKFRTKEVRYRVQ